MWTAKRLRWYKRWFGFDLQQARGKKNLCSKYHASAETVILGDVKMEDLLKFQWQ